MGWRPMGAGGNFRASRIRFSGALERNCNRSGVLGGCQKLLLYSRGQRAKWACLHAHLATAARVKYPAALQRCKFDAPLLAAGLLTHYNREFIIGKRGKFGCCSSGGILRGGLLRGPGGRGRRRWCFPGARRRGWRGDRQIWVQGGTRRRRQREERRILWDFSGPPFCCVRVWRNAVFESVTMPYLNLL